jgi:hypothetical protein
MDALTLQNFKALSQGLKDERKKNSELAIKVSKLENTVAMMQTTINNLTPQVMYLKAKSQGTGATA